MVPGLIRYVARSKRRRRWGGAAIRLLAPMLPRRPVPHEPIFILGSPRSGTTILFELLDRSPEVASLGGESHLLWELYHPSSATGWTSHSLDSRSVTPDERRAISWMIHALSKGRRYLDKSPRNSLRVEYLASLFPSAWFVFLKRDGRAAVSSLLTGWRSNDPAFPGTPVSMRLSIRGYGGSNWKFLVPPGWEPYADGASLPEVCAFQWIAANEAILAGRDAIGSERWVELSYEDLVRSPRRETERVFRRLKLSPSEEVLSFADELHRHVTRAVTRPRTDKWREENPGEIEQVLPLIAPMMRRLGYEPGNVPGEPS